MRTILDTIVDSVKKRVEDGYYSVPQRPQLPKRSLRASILRCEGNPIIAELKFTSPAHGVLRGKGEAAEIVGFFEEGGAAGVSVLTEKDHFNGSLEYLRAIRPTVKIPILMKDFVVSKLQVDAGSKMGADAVLMIARLFRDGVAECGIEAMLSYARERGLEVLLEAFDEEEYHWAVNTTADIIGINNRDLRTMKVDVHNTTNVLKSSKEDGRIIVSESGIESADDISFLKKHGAHAFLIGASIMKSNDVRAKVRELVQA